MTLNAVNIFAELFSGNKNSYGCFIPDKNATGGKVKGQSSTVNGIVTEFLYRDHLSAVKGLGICPVTSDGKCRFTVIDVDEYTDKYAALPTIISKYGMPIICFKSKSGGLHLYTFYASFVDAKIARQNAEFMRALLGLAPDTEIFPKQNYISPGASGNWINLPYFGGDNSPRAMLREDGSLIHSVDEAMTLAAQRAITFDNFADWQSTLPLFDAPPCLQAMYILGVSKNRNVYLFNLACYFKAKYGEDYEPYVEDANNSLPDPLTNEELQRTVFASMRKHTYTYQCKNEVLKGFCNKKICATRKYRVGDEISALSYEQLVQYNSDPPYYDWTINGKALRFNSESEIIQQDKFIELCMRHLGVLPNKLKRENWTAIVNEALQNRTVKEVEYDTSTPLAIMRESGKQFLLSCRLGDSMEDSLGVGKPYIRSDASNIYTTMRDLYTYIVTTTKQKITNRDIADWLYSLGATPSVRKVNLISIRVWVVPVVSLFESIEDAQNWVKAQDNAAFAFGANSVSAEDVAKMILDSAGEKDL